MVTVISNVTRDMTEISCYADNGYGTPMQSSVAITITRKLNRFYLTFYLLLLPRVFDNFQKYLYYKCQ